MKFIYKCNNYYRLVVILKSAEKFSGQAKREIFLRVKENWEMIYQVCWTSGWMCGIASIVIVLGYSLFGQAEKFFSTPSYIFILLLNCVLYCFFIINKKYIYKIYAYKICSHSTFYVLSQVKLHKIFFKKFLAHCTKTFVLNYLKLWH